MQQELGRHYSCLVLPLYDHVDVYLDESGDLGFSPSSSRHLVVAGVASTESFRFRRLVRGTRRRFRSEAGRRSELKFNRSSGNLRAHMLNQVAGIDSLVVWAGMKKEGFPERLKARKEELLRGMFGHVASEVSRRLRSRHIDIVMDRRLHKEKERNEFDSILKGAVLTGHAGYFPPNGSCQAHRFLQQLRPAGGGFCRRGRVPGG